MNKEANESFYKAWVQSHSPLRIKEANSARLRLKLLTKDRKRPIKLSKIKDDRQVPRPLTPFMQFSKERRASGDFKHLAAGDILKQLAREWAAMTPEDKKVRVPMDVLVWGMIADCVFPCRNTKMRRRTRMRSIG